MAALIFLSIARTHLYGIGTDRSVGQKLWQSVPKEIKESQTLEIFKRNNKAIPPDQAFPGRNYRGAKKAPANTSAWANGPCKQ